MSKLIQIGDITLREIPGFHEKLAHLRQRHAHPKRQKSDGLQLKVCENPAADWGTCRALKADGERCTHKRRPFNFFCGSHNRILHKELKDVTTIFSTLRHIGFRGSLKKTCYITTYTFWFYTRNQPRFRIRTEYKAVAETTVRDWIKLAMNAEERAYWPIKCVKCGKRCVQAEGTGIICNLCNKALCLKCWSGHRHPEDSYAGWKLLKTRTEVYRYQDTLYGGWIVV